MHDKIETRFSTPKIEIRNLGTPDKPQRYLVGPALRYNVWSSDEFRANAGFRERVLPNAAAGWLSEDRDVLFAVEHSIRTILGRRNSGTLKLLDGPDELRFELLLPDTTLGRDVEEMVKRGDLAATSFGFNTRSDHWHREGEELRRDLRDIELIEISLTALPAYPRMHVDLRSVEDRLSGVADWREAAERRLRLAEAG